MLLILFFSCRQSAVMMGGTAGGGPPADEVTPRCDTSRPNQNTPAAPAPRRRRPDHAITACFKHGPKVGPFITRRVTPVGLNPFILFLFFFSFQNSTVQLKKHHPRLSCTSTTSCRLTEQQVMELWSPSRCVTYRAGLHMQHQPWLQSTEWEHEPRYKTLLCDYLISLSFIK